MDFLLIYIRGAQIITNIAADSAAPAVKLDYRNYHFNFIPIGRIKIISWILIDRKFLAKLVGSGKMMQKEN